MKDVFKDNTYFRKVKEGTSDRIDVEIGDSKQDDFKPQFKIKRWDNEVNFSMRAEEHDDAVVETEEEKIKYITPDYEVHQYDKDVDEDGGFEFEWVLNKKPKSNVLTATIETKDLDFFYQPELTQKEIDESHAQRPENVVGSYAVYHKTKQGNINGGKHYKTGKAFHIYRPEAVDADGNKIWCELHIDDVLTVTVPQDFLDKAKYPVIVDPTFGYTSVGSSSNFWSYYAESCEFTLSENGEVESISLYSDDSGSVGPKDCITGIYDSYFNLEDETATGTIAQDEDDWRTFTFATELSLAADDYRIGFRRDGNIYKKYDSGALSQNRLDYLGSYSASMPDPFGNDSAMNEKVSIYATYTTGIVNPSAETATFSTPTPTVTGNGGSTSTVGNRFVQRHNAARTSTSNTTAADISYDTNVITETGYTWSSPEVTVDSAGKYLFIFDIGQVDIVSTRAVGTLVPAINSTNQERFRATHRYLRNSGGSQEGASIGMAILDLAASDDVKVRNPGVLTPTDALGVYGTNASYGGALQMIYLGDGNITHVERTVDAYECGVSNINTTRPWIDSSGTWTQVTFNSEVSDDAGLYSGTGGDITLEADKKYMIVWGLTPYSTDASRHAYVGRLQIGLTNVQTGSSYHRNTASQGPPMSGMYLHEVGGGSETLKLHATQESEGGDAGIPVISDAYVQVIELPDSAEWIHVDNGATDSMTTDLAGLTTWYDTPLSSTLRADGDSNLSLDGTNNAVQNDSGDTLPVLAIGWHRWDRDSGSSGIRKNPWTRWDNGGSAVGYGIASSFSRGQQSGDDTWQAHYCSAVTLDLANSADLSFQAQDEASATQADMGIYASTSRYFLGVQVLNLESLVEAGGTDVTVTPSVETSTYSQPTATVTTERSVSVSATLQSFVASLIAPTITAVKNISYSAGISFATFALLAPTVSLSSNVVVEPSVESASFSEIAPTITTTRNVEYSANVETAIFTNPQPSLNVSDNETVSANIATATFTTPTPTVTILQGIIVDADVFNSTFSQLSPTVTGIRNVSITPSLQTGVFSTPTFTVSTERNVVTTPLVESSTFELIQPSLSVQDTETVVPSVENAVFTELSPTITTTQNATVLVDVEEATFSIQTPSISTSGNVSVVPSVEGAIFSMIQPSLTVNDNETIFANAESAVFNDISPTVIANRNVVINTITESASFSQLQPTIVTTGSIEVEPIVEFATFSQLTPLVETTASVEVEATTETATFTTQSPTVISEINVVILAGVEGAIFSMIQPSLTVNDNETIVPSVQSATFTELVPTVTAESSVGGQIKHYNGSVWTIKPVKVYNGSIWETKPLNFYNGSTWEETNY